MFPELPITPQPPDMPLVESRPTMGFDLQPRVGKRFRPVGLHPDVDFQKEAHILKWAELLGSDLQASETGRRCCSSVSVSDAVYQVVQNILFTKADGTDSHYLRYCCSTLR
eukprot:46043-Amphidinium_carterae.1